jgi:hypothetical protein
MLSAIAGEGPAKSRCTSFLMQFRKRAAKRLLTPLDRYIWDF